MVQQMANKIKHGPSTFTPKNLAVNQRLGALQLLLNKYEKPNLHSKLKIYKSLMKPMWSYGIELWGAARISNINKIQTLRSKTLRRILNAPPYVSNQTIYNDLHLTHQS